MKQLFDEVSLACSKLTTRAYSTSFSLGIRFLNKRFHGPIYSIYGFVRFADEIVDTFHDYNKRELLDEFMADTWKAIDRKISTNPVLNSFQAVVHEYRIDSELIRGFFRSMEADLHLSSHSESTYKEYIFGSAETVGLMCLKVFCEHDDRLYERLTYPARKLGAAFQKVNFLRDIRADFLVLGRAYFPGVNFNHFSKCEKETIQRDIAADFDEALQGIRALPDTSRSGVYLAYFYYRKLFNLIQDTPPELVLNCRIRIPDHKKFALMFQSVVRNQLNLL